MAEYKPRPDFVQNVSDKATYACTAHIPVGPHPCRGCTMLFQLPRNVSKDRGRCRLWARMKGFEYRLDEAYRKDNPHDWHKEIPMISAATPCCKYYDPKPVVREEVSDSEEQAQAPEAPAPGILSGSAAA
jgi:hypothetical protein